MRISDDPLAAGSRPHPRFAHFGVCFCMRYRQVLRRLAHSPGFTAIAVLTLALGIGAHSAVFSVLEDVLLKPLPYPHPEELISVRHSAKDVGELEIAPFLYFTYREQNRTLRNIGVWDTKSSSVTGLGEPEHVDVLLVTDGILPFLGISPALGRWFSGRDESPGTLETVSGLARKRPIFSSFCFNAIRAAC